MTARFATSVPVVTVLLVIAGYVPFLGGGFLTDDFAHLERLTSMPGVTAALTLPDAFGFYRPITQASLRLDLLLFARNAAGFRVVNLALHAGVLAAAFLLARLLLGQRGALLAAMMFALTPKAHPIAVLWISARAELLMSVGALVAVTAWIVWSRHGRTGWLAVAAAAYAFAILSKESAVLLPALLLVTPGATRPLKARALAVGGFCACATAVFLWRHHLGALMPGSPDAHYSLAAPPARWIRNLRNYLGRMMPGPLSLMTLVAAASALSARATSVGRTLHFQFPVLIFALLWSLIFLAPVLPIAARSELYLYLPVFGLCLLAASMLESLLRDSRLTHVVLTAIVAYAIVLGGYQASRSRALHWDLEFSAAFVLALEGESALATWRGPIVLVPADAATERFLEDAIGGYLSVVLRQVFSDARMTGTVEYDGFRAEPRALRLSCAYRNGRVRLHRESRRVSRQEGV
jgi:hypothetical protein